MEIVYFPMERIAASRFLRLERAALADGGGYGP